MEKAGTTWEPSSARGPQAGGLQSPLDTILFDLDWLAAMCKERGRVSY